MSRSSALATETRPGAPRASGDEPTLTNTFTLTPKCAPRERG